MNEINEEIDIIDDETDENIPYKYSITSYGADFPVDGLVKRLLNKSIYIPHFQREFVWSQKQASKFIESLLLGLPVPSIFLSKESDTGKHIVIDGQQRLKSIQFFYEGLFEGKEFKLSDVQEFYENKTYKTLTEEEKRHLDDYLIHATIVKQDEPSDNQSSIYHIFERLNTGGITLQPQEIRACIFYGPFNVLLNNQNNNKDWRDIYGIKSKRMKDQELILRFFALYYNLDNYNRPLKEFLNNFMSSNRKLQKYNESELNNLFFSTINLINKTIGKKAFRPEKAFNAAVYDSIMVGLATRMKVDKPINEQKLIKKYNELLDFQDYMDLCIGPTADKLLVQKRIKIVKEKFQDL